MYRSLSRKWGIITACLNELQTKVCVECSCKCVQQHCDTCPMGRAVVTPFCQDKWQLAKEPYPVVPVVRLVLKGCRRRKICALLHDEKGLKWGHGGTSLVYNAQQRFTCRRSTRAADAIPRSNTQKPNAEKKNNTLKKIFFFSSSSQLGTSQIPIQKYPASHHHRRRPHQGIKCKRSIACMHAVNH